MAGFRAVVTTIHSREADTSLGDEGSEAETTTLPCLGQVVSIAQGLSALLARRDARVCFL
jgi:hypothetical protein